MHSSSLLYCRMRQALVQLTTQLVSERVSRRQRRKAPERVTPVTALSILQDNCPLSNRLICMHAHPERLSKTWMHSTGLPEQSGFLPKICPSVHQKEVNAFTPCNDAAVHLASFTGMDGCIMQDFTC